MSSYVGLAALKAAVGLKGSDTTDDATLTSCIVRASGKVDAYLDRNRVGYVGFAASSNSRTSVGSSTRVYDGSGDSTLFIDDFTSVSTVSVDTVSVSSNAWRLWPYNESPKRAIIYADPVMDRVGLTTDTWTLGTANVAVTGYAGVDHVPSDVEQASLAVAILYWQRLERGEPEPVVAPSGARGYLIDDPEVEGILTSALAGWVSIGVWGA